MPCIQSCGEVSDLLTLLRSQSSEDHDVTYVSLVRSHLQAVAPRSYCHTQAAAARLSRMTIGQSFFPLTIYMYYYTRRSTLAVSCDSEYHVIYVTSLRWAITYYSSSACPDNVRMMLLIFISLPVTLARESSNFLIATQLEVTWFRNLKGECQWPC